MPMTIFTFEATFTCIFNSELTISKSLLSFEDGKILAYIMKTIKKTTTDHGSVRELSMTTSDLITERQINQNQLHKNVNNDTL